MTRRGAPETRTTFGERMYRALLLLYPPSFRRDYGEEMARCARDARRDGFASWARSSADVVRTAPRRHLEVIGHMSTTKLLVAATVTTVGIVAFAVVGGAWIALMLMLLLAWILWSLLQSRGAPPRGLWWKTTAVGVGIFGVAFVVFAGPWPDSWRDAVPASLGWWTGLFMFIAAIVCVATGLLAGLVVLATRRRATR